MKQQKLALLQGKTAPERLNDLKNRVRRLAALCPKELRARAPVEAPVEIVAVSKGQTHQKILPLLHAGHRVFGENRIVEAQEKWPALKQEFSDVRLHLIGALQTNKIDAALDLFDVIETLDRKKLADRLSERAASGRALPRLFIQVNTGAEPQKSGIEPEMADEFISYCRNERGLPVEGLMCLPPLNQNPAPHFALLYQIAQRHRLPSLSMGMSHDFEAAILLGATHIRPGRIIFGVRS